MKYYIVLSMFIGSSLFAGGKGSKERTRSSSASPVLRNQDARAAHQSPTRSLLIPPTALSHRRPHAMRVEPVHDAEYRLAHRQSVSAPLSPRRVQQGMDYAAQQMAQAAAQLNTPNRSTVTPVPPVIGITPVSLHTMQIIHTLFNDQRTIVCIIGVLAAYLYYRHVNAVPEVVELHVAGDEQTPETAEKLAT